MSRRRQIRVGDVFLVRRESWFGQVADALGHDGFFPIVVVGRRDYDICGMFDVFYVCTSTFTQLTEKTLFEIAEQVA